MEPMNDAPDGILDEKMSRLFGRSWRTSLGGLATGVCGVVVIVDQFVPHPALHALASVCVGLGLVGGGAIGFRAKDRGVTGAGR
jgi:hypothetical protein